MLISYNIQFTPAPGTITKIEYRKENETQWISPTSPDNPTSLSSYKITIDGGSRYYIRVTSIGISVKCANQSRIIFVDTSLITGTTTSTTTTSTTTTILSCPIITNLNGEFIDSTLVAYWGWEDTKTILTSNEIKLSPNSQLILPSQSVTCDFGGANNVPKYLWMAEPQEAITKTKWQDIFDVANNGAIGTDQDLFGPLTMSGNFRFYITEYKTEQKNPIQFRVS